MENAGLFLFVIICRDQAVIKYEEKTSYVVIMWCVRINFLAIHREICYNEAVVLQPCSIEEEVLDMAVSYKKLFKILIDRDMKKKEFRDFVGISYSTMSKLEKGENTTVEVLEKICLKLGCGIDDIMEILPDSPDNGTGQGVE